MIAVKNSVLFVILAISSIVILDVQCVDSGNFALGRTCLDSISTPGFVTVPSHVVQKLKPSVGSAVVYVSLVHVSGGLTCAHSRVPFSKWGCCYADHGLSIFLTTDRTGSVSSILFPIVIPGSTNITWKKHNYYYDWVGHSLNDPVLPIPIKWPISNASSFSFYIYQGEALYAHTTSDNWGSVCTDVFIGLKPEPPTQQSKNCDTMCCTSISYPAGLPVRASQVTAFPSKISVMGGTLIQFQSVEFPLENFTATCSFQDPVFGTSIDVAGMITEIEGQRNTRTVSCESPLLYDTGIIPITLKAIDEKGVQKTFSFTATAEIDDFVDFNVEFVRNAGQLNDPITSIKVAWNPEDNLLQNATRVDLAIFYVADDNSSQWSLALYLAKNALNKGFLQIDQSVFGETFNKMARIHRDVSYLFTVTRSGLLEVKSVHIKNRNLTQKFKEFDKDIRSGLIYDLVKCSLGFCEGGNTGDSGPTINTNVRVQITMNLFFGICIIPPPKPTSIDIVPAGESSGWGGSSGGGKCPKPKCPPPGPKCKDEKCKKYNKGGCKGGGDSGSCGGPGGGFGDPHFTTFDGLYYTHMGRGEFWLFFPFQVKGHQVPIISLQGRMTLHSWWPDATWFTAFAGLVNHQLYPTLFQIEVDPDKKQQLLIHLNCTKMVIEPGQSYYPGFTLKIADGNTEATIFTKDVTFIITRASDYALGIAVYIDYKWKNKNAFASLWGNFNGDPSDDLTAPDGSRIPSTASMREIQSHFRKWQLKSSVESFFRYPTDESFATHAFPDWEPRYYDIANPPAQAVAICGASKTCLYDYQATGGNSDAAKLTAAFDAKLQAEIQQKNRSEFCPEIGRPENGFAKLIDDETGSDDPVIGSTVNFSCYSTFKLVGTGTAKCLASRSWSSSTPKCQSFRSALQESVLVAVIVGSVISGIMVLVLIIVIVIFFVKRQQKQKLTVGRTRTPPSATTGEEAASETLLNK